VRVQRNLARLLNPRADLSRLRCTAGQPLQPAKVDGEVRRRRLRPRHVLFNVPLLAGGLIVLAVRHR